VVSFCVGAILQPVGESPGRPKADCILPHSSLSLRLPLSFTASYTHSYGLGLLDASDQFNFGVSVNFAKPLSLQASSFH